MDLRTTRHPLKAGHPDQNRIGLEQKYRSRTKPI
jgi:hypothetical protein